MAGEEDSSVISTPDLLPETLISWSSSSSLFDQDRPLDSALSSSSSLSLPASSSFSLPSPPLDPDPPPPAQSSIPRSFSYSKLNAKAPEFIPRSSSTSSLSVTSAASAMTSPGAITVAGTASATGTTTQQASFVIPQPPGPPALVHVYASTTPPAGASLFTTQLAVQGPYAAAATGYQLPVQYNKQYYGSPGALVAGDQQPDLLTLAVAAQSPAAMAALTGMAGNSDQGAGAGSAASASSKSGLTDEVSQKILNQVEYYFSDLNLATTDHLIRFMNKDPEGYVPITVVASFKKIKAVISSNSQLANILRSSEKLVVSEDGKKVKRVNRLTESDMEELQLRIVVAENLPEDHCHQTLMKIFSAVGSVKTIRTCHPQTSNGGASPASRIAKTDGMLFSNKLHAFVEYESVELAEKAVAELNDENNWRNGLKVRLLLRLKTKSSQARAKKAGQENEQQSYKEDAFSPEDDAYSNDLPAEDDKEGEQKKVRNRGRGKGRGRPQYQPLNNRGSVIGSPPTCKILSSNEQPVTAKQPSVPRMPDGTRGFSMGRGKPIAVKIA